MTIYTTKQFTLLNDKLVLTKRLITIAYTFIISINNIIKYAKFSGLKKN